LTKVQCNLCGSLSFRDFGGRPRAQCTACGSLERTRFLWLYLRRIVEPGHKVLHFAPEKGLYQQLKKRLRVGEYTVADIDPSRYSWADEVTKMDMTKLDDLKSRAFDFVIHSHVLEHIPCNLAYPLFHIHRALADSGRHIFIIPIMRGKFYASQYSGISTDERIKRFGQYDHVRLFGSNDLDASLGQLINLPTHYDACDEFSEEELRAIGLSEGYWKGLSMNSIIDLGRNDMKFLNSAD